MSEFKFACPVCGQHITADSNAAGSQLECPTCFRKIIVPQGSSSDPKFILAASEANKPRPAPTAAPESSPPPVPNALPVSIVLLIILICAAGTALFVVRGKLFGSRQSQEVTTSRAADEDSEETPVHATIPTPRPNSSALPALWTLDLTNTTYPSNTVFGRIRGQDFYCGRAFLQNGTLTFRKGISGQPDLAVNIAFFVNTAAQLAGRLILVTTNDTASPRTFLRWKEGAETMSESFSGGYAMKLELGPVGPSGLPGKIFLCFPDSSNSWVAGTFTAEIRKPAQPRPRPPKKKTT